MGVTRSHNAHSKVTADNNSTTIPGRSRPGLTTTALPVARLGGRDKLDALENYDQSICISVKKICNLRFADDIDLLSRDEDGLQERTDYKDRPVNMEWKLVQRRVRFRSTVGR